MEDSSPDIDWDLLIEDMKNQECVLVIGPDLIKYGDFNSFFAAVAHELNGSRYINNVFEEEELFQIRISNPTRVNAERNDGIRQISKAITKVIDQYKSDLEEIADSLKALPLHLIISLYPEEKIISTAFRNDKYTVLKYYQKKKASEKEKFDEPSLENPIIYNLLGTLSDTESLVVTYDDLFDYIFSILGDHRIPEGLQNALKNTNRFIFLGVNFNKWYMHLLLKLLAADKAAIAIDNRTQEPSRTFILDRISLDMLTGTPKEFLQSATERYTMVQAIDNKVEKPGKITEKNDPITVFLSYSHVDEDYKKEMMITLNPLIAQKKIVVWDDRQIIAAQDWNKEITAKLNEAELVICLLSRNFLNSSYCVETEVSEAIQQQKYVLPVLLRSCAWLEYPFLARNQAIPRDNKSIASFKDQDEVYQIIFDEIKRLAELIRNKRN
jgi:hypothetical protein